MTASPSLETIFTAAIELPMAADRHAYVARACGDDKALRKRVEQLVVAHFRAGNFLEEGASALAETVDQSPTEGVGSGLAPVPHGGGRRAGLTGAKHPADAPETEACA